jgi:very-short-patch-repair endonuclease
MTFRAQRVNPDLLAFVRTMRQESAPAERIMWRCLRDRRLNGFKFRRQFPVGRYFADFYCAECRLVVELDGDTHDGREAEDLERTNWLDANGYHVARYVNTDVYKHLIPVLEGLLAKCEHYASRIGEVYQRDLREAPHPNPLP